MRIDSTTAIRDYQANRDLLRSAHAVGKARAAGATMGTMSAAHLKRLARHIACGVADDEPARTEYQHLHETA